MEGTQDVSASGDVRTWPLAAALIGREKHMEPSKRVPCPRTLASPLTALVLALAAVVLMAPIPPDDPARDYSERIFIGQFNMAGGADEYADAGRKAPDALVRSIKGRSPELAFVTINEGCKDWLDYLDEQLPDYNVQFDPVLKSDDKGNLQLQPCKHGSLFGNAIIYRKSFSGLQMKSYDLQSGPNREQRRMLCLNSDSKRLVVCAVHLVNGGENREQREREAERARSVLAENYAGYTVILGGDLNDEPGSEALSSFYLSDYGQGAHGAFKEVDSPCGDDIKERDFCRDGEHTHGELPKGGGPFGEVPRDTFGGINEKFDYLFVSPEVTVHDADATKSLYSDHDPLWAVECLMRLQDARGSASRWLHPPDVT
ncbi:endonuclease/exonuclease/phosphatase family protein, partial [Corallococcus aberystwythensis]